MPLPACSFRSLTCAALLLALGACGKGADQTAGKAAGAQVLPGTISDAMLNLDQSHSQPLLQPVQHTKDAAPDAATDDASDAAADTPVKPDAPAPAN